jgi:hypothetical protein
VIKRNIAMNNQDKKIPTLCGLSSLQRPYYSPGQLLDDEDLNAGVTYTQELTRLLFRSLFGCGVICGLQVKPTWACEKTKWSITVTKGLALDCQGDPIELPADATMVYGPDCRKLPDELWVTICYIEKCCRPKDVTCSQSDDAQSKPTRARAGYEIRLYEAPPKCACQCPTDDTSSQAAPSDECCVEAPQSDVEAIANKPQTDSTSNICDCYRPHFEGECECGCNCKCVILGKITVPSKNSNGGAIAHPVPTPDTKMVRRIRPLLNGYVDCGSLSLVPKHARLSKRVKQRPRGQEISELMAEVDADRLQRDDPTAESD